MCGRYKIFRLADFVDQFPKIIELFSLKPRYNIAPSQDAPIVRLNSDDVPVINFAKWGFIPHWAKEKPKKIPCNARSETVGVYRIFRESFAKRRCLVPADAFFEWKGKPNGIPHIIQMRDRKPFAFAGIWDRWKNEDGRHEDRFTILTTEPNEMLADIHDRMPVILDPADYGKWLDSKTDMADVEKLLKPYPAERMEALRISTRINKADSDDSSLIVLAESESLF